MTEAPRNDMNPFREMLMQLGFNQDTSIEILNQGIDSMSVLSKIMDEDIDELAKSVLEARKALKTVPIGVISFPFIAMRRFKAMRFWAAENARTGNIQGPQSFTDEIMAKYIDLWDLDKQRTELMENETPTKPKELTDLSKWEIFWEEWNSYVGRLRGAARCPLTYIFRPQSNVTPELLTKTYENDDTRLIATTLLSGTHYTLDNKRIFDEFKTLVLKGPGYSFIKQYDMAKDGRNAVLSLKRQCEGISAKQTRKAAAYAQIAAARFTGNSKRFTFDQYVEIHQTAYNTLMELNEVIPETKRVNDFLAGISDARLNTGKDLILGDEQKLSNFEACQQFLKTLISNKVIQDKHERNISSARPNMQHMGRGRGRQGRFGRSGRSSGRNQQSRNPRKFDDISARTYSPEEWAKLTPDQKKQIWELRRAKKARTDRNASTMSISGGTPQTMYDFSNLQSNLPITQEVATVSTITPNSTETESATHHVTFSPNVNFGRAAHPAKK